ncbi:unnamed protein product [Cylindrotheca closterium]|uniref:Uncharacterized protein n=1 Tax=Cylindrotheca closterium TaxID=2856 RepID=A0AAD2G0G1_9STRA|nr:unnamed protein product [Cylindrotheca closterium]
MANKKNPMPPASPSWISLRNNRANSMPVQRPRRGQRGGNGDGGGAHGRLKLWAQSILEGVGVSSPSPRKVSQRDRRRSLLAERQRQFQVPPPHGNLSFSSSHHHHRHNSKTNKVENINHNSPTQQDSSIPANVRVGIVLVHLQEHLPEYCQLLQEPTFVNCQEACQVLAKAIAKSMPSSIHAGGGSPKNNNGSPHSASSPSRSTPSPSRSPLRSLFGSGRDSSPPTRSLIVDSALALEREWERYTMPLQLLAASEALYANLHHAQDVYMANHLEGLYRWLADDLTLVKETLCDSVLATRGGAAASATSNSKASPTYHHRRKFLQQTAQRIAPILLLLAAMAKQRSRLIQYQATIWDNNNKKQFGLLGEALENLGKAWNNEWSTNVKISDVPETSSLVESLSNELTIWKHLLETANYLEKCRFTESILSSRKTKVRLNPTSTLKIQQWFVTTLQQMIASSYLYFDRVHTFAKPLYGFQNASFVDSENAANSRMGGSPHALEHKVLEFLHKQQKSGTADVAVTIVHDAVQTSNLHMERGFTLMESEDASSSTVTTTAAEEKDESSSSKYTELETSRLHWPAVYIRSTKHHGEAQIGVSLLGVKRRAATSRRQTKEDNSSSFTDHYKRWGSNNNKDANSNASGPTTNNKASNEASEAATQRNTLEYAPAQGSASWPHTEWESIVGLITGSGDLPSTARLVSNQAASTVTEDHGFFKFLGQSTPSLTQLGKDPLQVHMECVVRRSNNGRTAFWLAELSEFSWLVVLTKTEEESRWHRRRGSRFDDVEEFVQLLVSKLRVENCFQTLPKDLQEFPFERDLLQGMESANDWNETSAEDFLLSVKYSFGLSTRKPKVDPHKYNRRFRIGNNSPSIPQPPKPQGTMDSSAMAFFLGSDLMYGLA